VDEPDKFKAISKVYNSVAKVGAIETQDMSTQKKIAALIRFDSNQRQNIGLDAYIEQRKEGQNQIFFLANVGQTIDNLKKSVFVEKLTARGYEVLLMNDAMYEVPPVAGGFFGC
jgi:heat shock protein beta